MPVILLFPIAIAPVIVPPASASREVSDGCTWSGLAYVVPVPIAAVPSIAGVVLDGAGTASIVCACATVRSTGAATDAVLLPLSVAAAIVARSAFVMPALATASVTVPVVPPPVRPVPAVTPVIVPPPAAPTAAWTKAVLAICVVLVPGVAVGVVGVPVKAGEANAAREVSVGWI